MKMNNQYSAGVIGLGRIGMLMEKDIKRVRPSTHTGGYFNNERISKIFLCDIDKNKRKIAEELFGSNFCWFSDYKELLANKPDIVSVCTLPCQHHSIVEYAALEKTKVILCEKPISVNIDDALSMIDSCKNNSILLINHLRRFLPVTAKYKEYLDSGAIGKVKKISCYYTAGINNTGTHLIDLLNYLFGTIYEVSAFYSTGSFCPTNDINVDGILFFNSGINASIQSLDKNDYAIFDIIIYGTYGKLKITDFGMRFETYGVKNCKQFDGYKELDKIIDSEYDYYGSLFDPVIQHIIDCLDNVSVPLSTGNDGLDALKVILAISKSCANNGKIIKI